MWWVFPIFWIFFIFLFFFVFRWGCGWGWRGRGRRHGEDAVDILRRRFARGEIDEAEYRRLRDVLAR